MGNPAAFPSQTRIKYSIFPYIYKLDTMTGSPITTVEVQCMTSYTHNRILRMQKSRINYFLQTVHTSQRACKHDSDNCKEMMKRGLDIGGM